MQERVVLRRPHLRFGLGLDRRARVFRIERDRPARALDVAPDLRAIDRAQELFDMRELLDERGEREPVLLPAQHFEGFLRRITFPVHELEHALIERGETEICKTYPGVDEDLFITAEAEAFVRWHAGQLTWAEATREDRIQVDGHPSLVRAFPTWNARSMFAHIRPVSRT